MPKHYFTLFPLLLCFGLLSCRQNAKLPPPQAPQPAPEPPAPRNYTLSLSQVDSLAAYLDKPLPASLSKALFDKPIPDTTKMHLLIGQLDNDPEPEKVVWFKAHSKDGDYGNAAVLDRQNDHWQTFELVYLDFWHGEHPPRLDAKIGALLVYSYGWGSSYRSEAIGFFRVADGQLFEVLKFLEWEGSALSTYCGVPKTLSGTYQCKGKNLILASYRYTVREETGDTQKGRIIYQGHVDIPFHWSAADKAFLPKVPAGFPDEALDLSDGEFSFDQYFDPMLQQVKTHGPKWKRLALCNQEEE